MPYQIDECAGERRMRAQWDHDLSELCGGSSDPDAGRLANRIEAHIKSVEKQRDDHFAEIERARDIITALTLYREKLVCFISNTTPAQRNRMRELATQDCDYDRSVIEVLDDFDRLRTLCEQPVERI